VRLRQPQAHPTTSIQSVFQPIVPDYYINGYYPYNGAFSYARAPGSVTSFNVTATYPWSSSKVISNVLPLYYVITPFPSSGSIPTWLSLSAPASATMEKNHASSGTLTMIVSDTAESGQSTSFALDAYFTDPLTGITGYFVIDFNIVVESTATGALPTRLISTPVQTIPQTPPLFLSSSWALGVGLCDLSSTTHCATRFGITWSSEDGVKTDFTVPSYTAAGSDNTFVVATLGLQASNGSYYWPQYVAIAPTTGSTWQLQMQIIYPHSAPCFHNTGTVSAGSAESLQIFYSLGWLAQDSSGSNFLYGSQCTNGGAPGSTVTGGGQEPFAFESYDGTSSDFNSLIVNANPVFSYTSNGGVSWTPPTHEFSATSNGGGLGGWTVGGSTYSPPSNVVEAGPNISSNCASAATSQIYLGSTSQSPLSSSCGTNSAWVELQ